MVILYVICTLSPCTLPNGGKSKVTDKIKSLHVPSYRKQAPASYFVSYDGTTNELYEALGYGEDKDLGWGIVISLTSYVGYGSKDLWEWLEIHDDD